MNWFKKNLTRLILAFLAISIGVNVYTLVIPAINNFDITKVSPQTQERQIGSYLDSISNSYITDVQQLAQQYNLPSWGCGPSTYALAKIINQRFFDDNLKIDATYSNHEYELVQRFGLAEANGKTIDHSWLEIYMGNQVMIIDPTVGQFGKYNSIKYQVFKVGDPAISTTLKNYNILDVRLTVLYNKVANRIPATSEPYPGLTINPESLDYYQHLIDLRNQVDNGQEPAEWHDWVTYLVSKY